MTESVVPILRDQEMEEEIVLWLSASKTEKFQQDLSTNRWLYRSISWFVEYLPVDPWNSILHQSNTFPKPLGVNLLSREGNSQTGNRM